MNHKDDIITLKYPKCDKIEFPEANDPFKDFLKTEAKIILDNLENYALRDHNTEPAICRYCNKRIIPPILPLILWNKDQIHYIEFHVTCVIKNEKLKDFVDFLDDFDYIYETDTSI